MRAPFDALSETIAATRGPLHLFRPYRDVRFAKDKTPYKTSAGAVTESDPRVALLCQKGRIVGRAMPRPKWMHTAKALDRLEAQWTMAEPLCRWLETHVGPSTLPPAEWG